MRGGRSRHTFGDGMVYPQLVGWIRPLTSAGAGSTEFSNQVWRAVPVLEVVRCTSGPNPVSRFLSALASDIPDSEPPEETLRTSV